METALAAESGVHMHFRILYFAKFREIAGQAEQELSVDRTLSTVRDLVEFLLESRPALAAIFGQEQINPELRVAVDQEFSSLDAPLRDGQEVAFFPPVTGG